MTDLPTGWEWSSLGNVGVYLNGRGFKKSEWRDAGRPIIRIQNLTGSGQAYNCYEGTADERHVVRDGDLLVSWAATLGVYVWRGPEALLNQHIFKVRSHLNPAFHRYMLTYVLDDLRRQTHGSGMVHITKGRFDHTPVPVPPLAEQERIVLAIEEHLSRLDATEAALVTAKRHCVTLRHRVVADAPEGDQVRLVELLREPLRNGLSAKASVNGTVRVVTLTAVTRSQFIDKHTKLIEPAERSTDDLWMQPGDLFIQRSNTPDLVGTAAMFRGPIKWAIFPDLLIRVRTNDRISPEYLELVLSSEPQRRYFRRAAQGIAGSMPKISQPIVENAVVPLPDRARQDEIVILVQAQLEGLHRLDGQLDQALARLRILRRSILAAAFSGQLVPQDSADQPASVLLQRIRAERDAQPPGGRARKVTS